MPSGIQVVFDVMLILVAGMRRSHLSTVLATN